MSADAKVSAQEKVKPGYRHPWLMVAVASLAVLALYVVLFGVPPIIPTLVSDVGMTHEQAGLLMTVSMLTYCLGSVLGGLLSDKIGARPVVVLGLLLAAMGGYLFTRTDNFPLMLAFRLFVGLGAAFVFAPGLRFLLAYLPREISGVGMSWYMVAVNAGVAAPLLATPLMMVTYGWEVPLQLYALFSALMAGLFWWAAQEGKPHLQVDAPQRPATLPASSETTPVFALEGSSPKGRDATADIDTVSGRETTARVDMTPTSGRDTIYRVSIAPFWSTALILVSIASLLRMSTVYGVLTWMPAYLFETLQFSAPEVAVATTVLSLSAVPALLAGGWLSDRTRQKVGLAIIGLLISSTPVLMAWLHTAPLWLATAIAFGNGFGTGISSVPIFSLPAMAVSPSRAGRATGFATTVTFAGPIATAYIGGYIVTATGAYDLAFLAFGLAPILGALVLAPLLTTFKPRW